MKIEHPAPPKLERKSNYQIEQERNTAKAVERNAQDIRSASKVNFQRQQEKQLQLYRDIQKLDKP